MLHFLWRFLLRCALWAAVAFPLLVGNERRGFAENLLPDLFPWENRQRGFMYNGVFDTFSIPHRVLYRFDVAIANIGYGPLEFREFTHPDDAQDIYQRIVDDQGDVTERLIGSFTVGNRPFGHLYLEGLAEYNLRTILPGGGVGPIVSSHQKTSFGVVDGVQFEPPISGAPAFPVYETAADELLGISVGWADWYRRALPGQWIDATGLPDGPYWLEVVIDPADRVLEADDENNTARVLVNLTIPGSVAGDFNLDGTVDAADYTLWRDKAGLPVEAGSAGDADFSGMIDRGDYELWRANFGLTDSLSSGRTMAIPEPSAGILLTLAAGAFCRPRCGRRRHILRADHRC